MKYKGISINVLSIGFFVLAVSLILFFGIQIQEADIRVEEQVQIEENRRLCEYESQNLADASDYLTSEVWHFVATRRVEHMENYWNEVENSRRRDLAIEHLAELSLTSSELALMENAKNASDSLIGEEAWAMRLTAEGIGMDERQMPAKVAAVRFTRGEEALTGPEKIELASAYIFGEDYMEVKQVIQQNIKSFRDLLRVRKNKELEAAVLKTRGALNSSQFLLLAQILCFALVTVLYYLLIIRPFHRYARALGQMDGKSFSLLAPIGSRETRSFAAAFNQIYSDWLEQKNRLEQERYRFRVALESTSVMVYEYDLVTDTYIAYGTIERAAGALDLPPSERVIPHFMDKHSDQILGPNGKKLLSGMLSGTDCAPVELEVHPYDSIPKLIWVQITGTPIFGEDHRLQKIIGRISNIQQHKEKEFALKDAQNRDELTGLYKREIGIRKAQSYMETKSHGEICCIMLLDMDDFAKINEEEGQVFADAVLQDVAGILLAKTKPDDIQIRLGGDEFMLFIKGCPKSRATILGPEIARLIRELSGQLNTDFNISASIGMCVTEVVDEYSGLYRCAESTLKYVKENGKGQAACYLDTSNELGMLLTQMYPDRHQINDIDSSEGAKEDLVSFALDLLGKAKNLDDAIFLLLSRVGHVCGMDRILIHDVDAEYLSCRIVYQWARISADRQSREPFYVTREDLDQLSRSYDAEGLCDRRIITGPCQMKSILHAAIWNYGICAGVMTFELRRPHRWSLEERNILSELAKIISSFTLKARADAVSQAKTDFLSRMSHEIRTPMNAITGMTTIAKASLGDPDRTLDCLNKIESANRYLLSLINDVLDMSRIESGKMEIYEESVDIGRLSLDLDTLIRPQTSEKHIVLEVKNGFAGNRQVMADKLRLTQVLVNLLGNAVKFTGEGGRVALLIEPLSVNGQEAVLRFSVADTGVGISKEAQRRIFNAFEQARSDTASSYGGTGLGLAISGKLVQLMGGSLEVESEPGKGAVFSFTLKLRLASDGQGSDQDDGHFSDGKRVSFDPAGKRLLLAEDNALNQEIAQEILNMNGFLVETAFNGKEALNLFKSREPGYYDAILMDIRMPVMDGTEATRQIRTLGKPDSRTIPIIAMTANAFDEDMKKSMEIGMDGHVSKPIDVDVLLETLSRLISERENKKSPAGA